MANTFTEQQVEDMVIHTLQANGWEYIPASELPRTDADVMVESHLRDALIPLQSLHRGAPGPCRYSDLQATCLDLHRASP